MDSSSAPSSRREELLEELCAGMERAQAAAAADDLGEVGSMADRADSLISALSRPGSAPPSPAEQALLERALALNTALLRTLKGGQDAAARDLQRTRGFLKALDRYRPPDAGPGGTLDVTD